MYASQLYDYESILFLIGIFSAVQKTSNVFGSASLRLTTKTLPRPSACGYNRVGTGGPLTVGSLPCCVRRLPQLWGGCARVACHPFPSFAHACVGGRGSADIHLVSKGHSGDGGNDRADEPVQWGEEEGPYAR